MSNSQIWVVVRDRSESYGGLIEKGVPGMLLEMLTVGCILAKNHGNHIFKSSLRGDISGCNNLGRCVCVNSR